MTCMKEVGTNLLHLVLLLFNLCFNHLCLFCLLVALLNDMMLVWIYLFLVSSITYLTPS